MSTDEAGLSGGTLDRGNRGMRRGKSTNNTSWMTDQPIHARGPPRDDEMAALNTNVRGENLL